MSERTWLFSRLVRIIVECVNLVRIALEFPILPAAMPFSLESHLGTMSFGGGDCICTPSIRMALLAECKESAFLVIVTALSRTCLRKER